MKRIIMLRHGQSQWNLENRFTGWTDVDLTDKGREEARRAGLKLLEADIKPRYYFTSYLKRAIHTLEIAADAMDRCWVPVIKDCHLTDPSGDRRQIRRRTGTYMATKLRRGSTGTDSRRRTLSRK